MARKTREESPVEEQAQPYQQASYTASIVDDSAALVNQSPMRASAAERESDEASVAPPARYRVQQSQYVMSKGGRTMMRAGKIIDSVNFDVPGLVSQGVSLEAL